MAILDFVRQRNQQRSVANESQTQKRENAKAAHLRAAEEERRSPKSMDHLSTDVCSQVDAIEAKLEKYMRAPQTEPPSPSAPGGGMVGQEGQQQDLKGQVANMPNIVAAGDPVAALKNAMEAAAQEGKKVRIEEPAEWASQRNEISRQRSQSWER